MFLAQIIICFILFKVLYYQAHWLYAFFINFHKKRVRKCVHAHEIKMIILICFLSFRLSQRRANSPLDKVQFVFTYVYVCVPVCEYVHMSTYIHNTVLDL